MEQNSRRLAFASLLLTTLLASPLAQAFSVKIHIYYANLFRDNLKQNFEKTGKYEVDLVRPDGKGQYKVTLKPEDAQAILEKPEYFRGGATGPDNTAFSGLTDPSHAAGMFPFQQCKSLLDAATEKAQNDLKSKKFSTLTEAQQAAVRGKHKEERAYALGCFLHGATDNVAHHLVNYFSHETFTLTPSIRAARTEDFLKVQLSQDRLVPECNAAEPHDGSPLRGNKTCEGVPNTKKLGEDFTNVVKHILVESNFEKAVISGLGGEASRYFKPSMLQHKLAIRLYRQAYLNPSEKNTHYNMRTMMGPIIAQKNQLIAEYLGKNIDKRPTTVTGADGKTESREDFDSVDFDSRRLDAVIDFLQSGGKVVGVDEEGSLAPYQYVLLLPELLERLNNILGEIQVKVVEKATKRCGGVKSVLPSCQFAKWLMEPNDLPGSKFKGSRIAYLVQTRKTALGLILDAHVQSIENLSNLLVIKEKSQLTPEDLKQVFKPLDEAVAKLEDTPKEFWPAWVRLFGLPEFFNTFAQKVKNKVITVVREKLDEYLLKLKSELIEMMGPMYYEYKAEVEQLQKKIQASIDAGKEKVGAHIAHQAKVEAGYVGEKFSMLEKFSTTVAHMNAFNSIAAVLADTNVVAPDENVYPQARHFFAGPVSFDASYQLEYNQLSVCPNLKKIFYPCGIKVSDMLQPAGLARCQEIQVVDEDSEPVIECHAGSKFLYAANPTKESCKFRKAEEFNSPYSDYVGSLTLSFPARLAPTQPVCLNLNLPVRPVQ